MPVIRWRVVCALEVMIHQCGLSYVGVAYDIDKSGLMIRSHDSYALIGYSQTINACACLIKQK